MTLISFDVSLAILHQLSADKDWLSYLGCPTRLLKSLSGVGTRTPFDIEVFIFVYL